MTLKVKGNEITINKTKIEWAILILIITFSFINVATLLISLILLLGFLKQKEIGAIKILNVITFRTMINPGIAVNIGELQEIKWVILFGCSVYLLFSYFKLENKGLKKINPVIIGVLVFFAYNVVIAFTISSLPIIALFKLISYTVIFLAVLIGVALTYKKIDWVRWMLVLLSLLILPSLLTLGLPIGYLRNAISFQGFTNQPNAFGVISVLYIALLLTNTRINNRYNKLFFVSSITLSIFMLILSKSRTAFIACLVIIALYIATIKIKKLINISLLAFSVTGVVLIMINTGIINFAVDYLYKGQEQGNLLYSRVNQIGELTVNFLNSPLFGNGFLIPVLPYKSFEFSFEYVVEPGNLIIAVLSYSGIIGFIFFLTYMIIIIYSNKKMFTRLFILPVSAILISMGEMIFFSSNGAGIWIYMFLAIYVSIDVNFEEESL